MGENMEADHGKLLLASPSPSYPTATNVPETRETWVRSDTYLRIYSFEKAYLIHETDIGNNCRREI